MRGRSKGPRAGPARTLSRYGSDGTQTRDLPRDVREVGAATLKAWMGHAKLTPTERYLHAKPRHADVARLDRAFAAEPALTEDEQTPAVTDRSTSRAER